VGLFTGDGSAGRIAHGADQNWRIDVTKVYLNRTTTSIFVGQTGHQHIRQEIPDGTTPFVINCQTCEPYLVKDFGGVFDPGQVPLTEKQIAERERAKEEGSSAVAKAAEALANTASMWAAKPDVKFEDAVEAEVQRRMNAKPRTRRVKETV